MNSVFFFFSTLVSCLIACIKKCHHLLLQNQPYLDMPHKIVSSYVTAFCILAVEDSMVGMKSCAQWCMHRTPGEAGECRAFAPSDLSLHMFSEPVKLKTLV